MTRPAFIDGETPSVRVHRHFDHPIERVWEALTTPDQLATWFPSEMEFEPEVGSSIAFPTFGDAFTGEVLALRPPHHFSFTWGGDTLTFDLEAVENGTTFTLTHWFTDRAGAASFGAGWEGCLQNLARYFAGDAGVFVRRSARHEELIHAFGLDKPAVSRSNGTWKLEWERQLVCPAEIAWDIFFGRQTNPQLVVPAVGEEFRPHAAPHVVLGTVTAQQPPHRFAFQTAEDIPGDHVELALTDGTGHGARLLLNVTGSDPEDIDSAIDTWGNGAVESVAREALTWTLANEKTSH